MTVPVTWFERDGRLHPKANILDAATNATLKYFGKHLAPKSAKSLRYTARSARWKDA